MYSKGSKEKRACACVRVFVIPMASSGSGSADGSGLVWNQGEMLTSAALVAVVVLLASRATALDNGLALTPPQAWTSWNLCRFDVNATLIMEMAEALESTGLRALGWDTLQIDEGWEACAEYDTAKPYSYQTLCKTRAPRDAQGRIVANTTKFPGGIKPLADWLHQRGFKIGIYTSASSRACGGNWGSRGYEQIDAAAFADWGVDWVKVDNCNYGSWARGAGTTDASVALDFERTNPVFSHDFRRFLCRNPPQITGKSRDRVRSQSLVLPSRERRPT